MVEVVETRDVWRGLLLDAEEVVDEPRNGWYTLDDVHWGEFFDALEVHSGVTFPQERPDVETPAMRTIREHVERYLTERGFGWEVNL